MMTTSKIKIHPSFKRLRYANACNKKGKEWISANPEIPWEFTNCDKDMATGSVKVTHSKGNPKANECYKWLCCTSATLVVLLIAKVVYSFQGINPSNLFQWILIVSLLAALSFALLTFWYIHKDDFYAVFSEEVDDYVAQKRDQHQAQKQAAIEKLEKHHDDAKNEEIEVGAGDGYVTH